MAEEAKKTGLMDVAKMAEQMAKSLGEFSELGADVALVGGNVITMNQRQPRAEAVALKDGKISRIGTNEEIRQLCGKKTETVELDGKTLLPGFIEPHTHMIMYGTTRLGIDAGMESNKNIGDILARVKEQTDSQPKGTWIEGWGYDDTLLPEKRHITREDLDSVAPDHFVHIAHVSGHLGVINSKVLEVAGITRDTPNPDGGEILKDAQGEPNGVLAETAQFMIMKMKPMPDVARIIEGLKISNQDYLAAGVTSVNDGGSFGIDSLVACKRAQEQGFLSIRVYANVFADILEGAMMVKGPDLDALEFGTGSGDDWFKIGAMKDVQDGSIQGYTGATLEPYYTESPTSTDNGLIYHTQEELNETVLKYHKAGFQIQVHGNGDRAIESIIQAYENAQERCPRNDTRHHIIHCQMVHDDQLDRMAKIGIVANFFPVHVLYWGDRHRDIFIGPERAARIDPLKSALDRGILFGLHADTPVTPVSPIRCLHSAVNRETSSGKILGPEQRITVQRALEALTINPATMIFEENTRGSIERGKLADFVFLSDDPFSIDPLKLKELQVEKTIVDGKIVYDAKHQA